MKKYAVGIEFDPTGEVKSTKGLIGGRKINEIRKKIKLNKKTNTYTKTIFDEKDNVIEIWKLTKKEYNELHCGFGQMWGFADFIKQNGLM